MTNDRSNGADLPPDAALLIDWENIKYSLSSRNRTVSISKLRDAAERHGRLVVARAYADWQERFHQGDAPNLYASGIEPIYVPAKHYAGDVISGGERRKNSVDVKLTADCIELCHRYPSIQAFVLVSGDQDFLHVVNTLRPYGKKTVVIGVSWTTSSRLSEQVDAMVFYDQEIDPLPEPAARPASTGGSAEELYARMANSIVEDRAVPHGSQPERVEAILRSILEVVHEYRGRQQTLLLSQLGLELQKRLTAGDFGFYVRGRLAQFVARLAENGLVQRVERGMVDWIFLPDEEVPADLGSTSTTFTERGNPPPSTHRTRTRYRDLPVPQQNAFIRAVKAIERSVEFLSFNRLAQELDQSGLDGFEAFDLRALIQDAQAEGILRIGEERQWFDAATGKTGTFNTVLLNEEHGDVIAALATND